MTEKIYDVVIVGTGPAGMFATMEFKKLSPESNVLMIDKGPLRQIRDPKTLTSGWGGAGTFTDGKLTLYFGAGGELPDMLNPNVLQELISYVDGTYLKFLGADGGEKIFGSNRNAKIKRLQKKIEAAGFKLVLGKVRHFGSDRTPKIVENIRQHLLQKGVEILLEVKVISVHKENDVFLLKVSRGDREEEILAKNVILAPGRDGAEWLASQAKKLGINLSTPCRKVDIGVRVETNYSILEELTDAFYDFKIFLESPSYHDEVRTFCVCPGGEVELEYANQLGVVTVNGHSVANPDLKTKNTNFAILVRIEFDQPFEDPIGYGKSICENANRVTGGKVIIQKFGDLKDHRRSRPQHIRNGYVVPTCGEALPGSLSFVLPERFMKDVVEMIEKMEEIAPGIAGPHTLLYGPEVKFYTNKIEMNENFETPISGLYAIGDASGISRGIMQASIMGVIAARDIIAKSGGKKGDENETA